MCSVNRESFLTWQLGKTPFNPLPELHRAASHVSKSIHSMSQLYNICIYRRSTVDTVEIRCNILLCLTCDICSIYFFTPHVLIFPSSPSVSNLPCSVCVMLPRKPRYHGCMGSRASFRRKRRQLPMMSRGL